MELHGLRQRVLSLVRIEYQQHFVRGRGVGARDHALDLLQFFHQVRLAVQPAGRVCDQYVAAAGFGRLHRVEGDCSRIRAGLLRDQVRAGALSPDGQLFDRRSAEGVARRQHHLAAFAAESAREFADAGGLARTVHADDEDHVGLRGGVDRQRPRTGGEQLRDRFAQRIDQRIDVTELLACDSPAQLIEQQLRGLDSDVRAEQACLEFIEDFRIDLPTAEQVAEIVGQPGARLVERAAQPFEKAFLLFALGHLGIATTSTPPPSVAGRG